MIIEIEDKLYDEVLTIIKLRNKTLYDKIKNIPPLQINTLTRARAIKTDKVKQSIKKTLKELLNESIEPTKYQLHKRTNIAYVTLNKYYDDILKEVQNER